MFVDQLQQENTKYRQAFDDLGLDLSYKKYITGGADDDTSNKLKMKKIIEELTKAYDVYNIDLMLKIITLMHFRDYYLNLFRNIFKGGAIEKAINDFTSLFFVEFNYEMNPPSIEILNLLNFQYTEKNTKDRDKFVTELNRDTKFRNAIVGDSGGKKYFFAYNLMQEICKFIHNDSALNVIFKSSESFNIFFDIFQQLLDKIRDLNHHINDLINKSQALINVSYNNLINSDSEQNKDVLTYVSMRNDTITSESTQINPRYIIKTYDTNPPSNKNDKGAYILMRYNNIDGHLGTDHAPDHKAYPIKEYTNNIKQIEDGVHDSTKLIKPRLYLGNNKKNDYNFEKIFEEMKKYIDEKTQAKIKIEEELKNKKDELGKLSKGGMPSPKAPAKVPTKTPSPATTLNTEISKLENQLKEIDNDEKFKKYKLDMEKLDRDLSIKNEYYMLGPYNNIFSATISNQAAANELIPLINELTSPKPNPICIIGYGQSGSGKTSKLIYTFFMKDGKVIRDNGIIMWLCNHPDVINIYGKGVIEVRMINLFVFFDANVDNIKKFDPKKHYYDYWITGIDKEGDSGKYKFKYTEGDWIYDKDLNANEKRSLGLFVNKGFDKREVEPTPNNPNSSRSHVLVSVIMKRNDNDDNPAKLILCDLAGVENVFKCNDDNVINTFDFKYSMESNKYKMEQKETKDFNDPIKNINFGEMYFKRQLNPATTALTTNAKGTNDQLLITDFKTNIENIMKLITTENNKIKSINKDANLYENPYNPKPIVGGNPENLPDKYTQNFMIKDQLKKPLDNLNEPIKSLVNSIGSERASDISDRQLVNKGEKDPMDPYYIYPPQCRKFGRVLTALAEFNQKTAKKIEEINNDIEILTTLKKEKPSSINTPVFWTEVKPKIEGADITYNDRGGDRYLRMQKLIPTITNDIKNFTQKSYEANKTNIQAKLNDLTKELEKYSSELQAGVESLYKNSCTNIRREMLKYNCNLRVQEGFMINNSLRELRENIITITLNKTKDELKATPILYYKKNLPYVKTKTPMIDNYRFFRNINNSELKYNDFGVLIKMMGRLLCKKPDTPTEEEMLANIKNLKFSVFTVINLSNSQQVNNPPNPPYININNLKIYKELYERYDYLGMTQQKNLIDNYIKAEFKDIIDPLLKQYDFYKILPNEITTIPKQSEKASQYINYIDSNNPSTLIGSLYGTDIIKNPFNNIYVNSIYEKIPLLEDNDFINSKNIKDIYLPQIHMIDDEEKFTINKKNRILTIQDIRDVLDYYHKQINNYDTDFVQQDFDNLPVQDGGSYKKDSTHYKLLDFHNNSNKSNKSNIKIKLNNYF